jgi:hypothetical protein
MSRELLDLALCADPALFAEQVSISPDPWQADFLRSTAQYTILLCSRQSGKSTITAVAALHRAHYYPGSLILLCSPTLRQSSELGRKVSDMQALLGECAIGVEGESALRLQLENGSRIIACPGTPATVRGYSAPDLIIVDEAAQADELLMGALRPMLAVSGGRLVLLSTPFSKRGFFYETWQDGGSRWQRVKVVATDCPRIDPAWLAAERATIGDYWWRQEYNCEFLEATDAWISMELITSAISKDIQPFFGPNYRVQS